MDSDSTGLLLLTSSMLSVAFLASVLWNLRGDQAIGPIVMRVRPGRGRRLLAVGFLFLLAVVLPVAGMGVLRNPALPVLLTAAALLLISPGLRDSTFATHGVRAGWFVRRFEDLEEWRLTGAHLRWKLFGEWQACEVPPAERDDLRARLEQLIPERESRFRS